MINVAAVINRPKLLRVKHLGRKHPLSPSVLRINLAKQLRHTKISKLEDHCIFLGRDHFIFNESRKHVARMNVLMGILIEVKVVYRLKKASRYWHNPDLPIKILHTKKVLHGNMAPFRYDVEGVSKLECIIHKSNIGVSEGHQLDEFCLS